MVCDVADISTHGIGQHRTIGRDGLAGVNYLDRINPPNRSASISNPFFKDAHGFTAFGIDLRFAPGTGFGEA